MKSLIPINIKHCPGQQESQQKVQQTLHSLCYMADSQHIFIVWYVWQKQRFLVLLLTAQGRRGLWMVPSPKKQNSPPFSTNGAFSTLSLFHMMTYCNQTKLVVFVSPVNSHTVRQCETWTFSFPHILPHLQPYSTFTVKQSGLPPSMSCTQCIEPESRDNGWC